MPVRMHTHTSTYTHTRQRGSLPAINGPEQSYKWTCSYNKLHKYSKATNTKHIKMVTVVKISASMNEQDLEQANVTCTAYQTQNSSPPPPPPTPRFFSSLRVNKGCMLTFHNIDYIYYCTKWVNTRVPYSFFTITLITCMVNCFTASTILFSHRKWKVQSTNWN